MPVLDINNREDVERYIKFTKTSKYATATQDMEWALVKKDWKSEHVYIEMLLVDQYAMFMILN